MPHAPEAAEPRHSERHAVVVPRDSVSIDGAVVDATSGTAVLKAACTSLGLKTSGNRKQLRNRLRDQVLRDEIQASSLVRHKLEQDVTRKAAAPSVAATANLEEQARHNLVHEPCEAWCQHCVSHRARQDAHREDARTRSAVTVVSLDYGFVSRRTGDDGPSLTVLFGHDRATKSVLALPTPSKGGILPVVPCY